MQRLPGVDRAALCPAAEADASRAIEHAGAAPVEEMGITDDGQLYLAAARPIGGPLRDLLASDEALPVRRALRLGIAAADAVAAAHEVGVVHGRLTPDSVFVMPPESERPESVVVLGLGTATANESAFRRGPWPSEACPFLSPERAAGGPASVADDVFGLGSVIMSMFTGGPLPVVRMGGRGPVPAAGDPEPGLIIRVLRRARAAHPTHRFSSAAALGAALREIEDALENHPAEERPTVPPPSSGGVGPRYQRVAFRPAGPGRRRALVAAGVAGVLAAGGAARVWHGRHAPVPNSTLASVTGRAPTPPRPATVPAAPPVSVPVTPPPVIAARLATARVADRSIAAAERGASARRPAAVASFVSSIAASGEATTVGGVVANAPAPVPVAAIAVVNTPAPASAAGDVDVMPPNGPSAAERTVAGSAAGVRAAVAAYASAIEARDLASLERAYPGMTRPQRRAWASFFASVADLRAQLEVAEVTAAGATAQARVRGTYAYQNLRPHRAERAPVSFTATLAREGAGWRVRAVE